MTEWERAKNSDGKGESAEGRERERERKKMLAFPMNGNQNGISLVTANGEDTETEQYFRNLVPRIQTTNQFGL